MLHTKYQGSKPYGFRQEDFFIFSLYKPMFNLFYFLVLWDHGFRCGTLKLLEGH